MPNLLPFTGTCVYVSSSSITSIECKLERPWCGSLVLRVVIYRERHLSHTDKEFLTSYVGISRMETIVASNMIKNNRKITDLLEFTISSSIRTTSTVGKVHNTWPEESLVTAYARMNQRKTDDTILKELNRVIMFERCPAIFRQTGIPKNKSNAIARGKLPITAACGP